MLTERNYGGEFLMSEANGYRSRENIVIGASQTLEAGSILGIRTMGNVTTAAGTNTGNGTITMNAAPLAAGAMPGNYSLVCTGGSFTVGAPAASGTGNGTLTRANPAFSASAHVGTYTVRFVEKTTDSGEFVVIRPDGTVDGYGVVGTAYDGQVKFTIADGATDFDQTSQFTLAVTAAVAGNGGVFSVTAPDGTALAAATVGVAYTTQIKFTIADGTADFIVGDSFTVIVAAGDGQYFVADDDALNGTAVVAGILFEKVTTGVSETAKAAAIVRDAEVNGDLLDYADLDEDATDTALAALGIIVR